MAVESASPRRPQPVPDARLLQLDFAVLKDFKLPREKMKIQFRAETFNILNHSNMYGQIDTNFMSSGQVLGKKGVPLGGAAKERRNIQLALPFEF